MHPALRGGSVSGHSLDAEGASPTCDLGVPKSRDRLAFALAAEWSSTA